MQAKDQYPAILPGDTGRPGSHLPVENIVESRINGLLRDKARLADTFADEKLKRETLDRKLKCAEEEFQRRFREAEKTIDQLRTKNDNVEATNVCHCLLKCNRSIPNGLFQGSLKAQVTKLEADLTVVSATLDATHQEFHHSHNALIGMKFIIVWTVAYAFQTPTSSCKMPRLKQRKVYRRLGPSARNYRRKTSF